MYQLELTSKMSGGRYQFKTQPVEYAHNVPNITFQCQSVVKLWQHQRKKKKFISCVLSAQRFACIEIPIFKILKLFFSLKWIPIKLISSFHH